MKTEFSDQQRTNPDIQMADDILRKCVHCGFCTATCPTYVTLGDELDSPRGRIYQIKDLLENERQPSSIFVTHIDRCLSCLSCMTTCPSGVHYMHLVDLARTKIEQEYIRPLYERLLRSMLAWLFVRPKIFRLALAFGFLTKPLLRIPFLPRSLRALGGLAPTLPQAPTLAETGGCFAPKEGATKLRILLLQGCVQNAINPEINNRTIDLLNRLGVQVITSGAVKCCGALSHHMGKTEQAHDLVIENIAAWQGVDDNTPVDAIISNASGCGTMLKDYGHMLKNNKSYKDGAAWVSEKAMDVVEFIAHYNLITQSAVSPHLPEEVHVVYHSACSLQHGQQIKTQPVELLRQAGFKVSQPQEGHLCCGSAGTYNIFQSEIAEKLKNRKITRIHEIQADVLSAGNIGCLTQLQSGLNIPAVHTAALLDWALGGEKPFT